VTGGGTGGRPAAHSVQQAPSGTTGLAWIWFTRVLVALDYRTVEVR
jgi:hypothetical protein